MAPYEGSSEHLNWNLSVKYINASSFKLQILRVSFFHVFFQVLSFSFDCFLGKRSLYTLQKSLWSKSPKIWFAVCVYQGLGKNLLQRLFFAGYVNTSFPTRRERSQDWGWDKKVPFSRLLLCAKQDTLLQGWPTLFQGFLRFVMCKTRNSVTGLANSFSRLFRFVMCKRRNSVTGLANSFSRLFRFVMCKRRNSFTVLANSFWTLFEIDLMTTLLSQWLNCELQGS